MIYILTALLGYAGAWWINRYAHLLGLIDKPNKRSSHDRPTPRGGGIGLLLAFAVATLWLGLSWYVSLPAAILSLLSLFDDRFELSPKFRLLAQFIAAGLFLVGINLPLRSGTFSFFAFPFFAVYIVGTTNFYNFMDGINGIAGITGIVGFLLLGTYGTATGQNNNLIVLAFGMASACAGFLPFNIPKPRVFMGDVGSILLGFVFACLVAAFAGTVVEFVILAAFLLPFYLDELVSIVERLRKKQRLTKPHRSHLYQVLANEVGIAHWKVALGYGIFQLATGLSVWGTLKLNVLLGFMTLGMFTGGFILANNRVKKPTENKLASRHPSDL